MKIWGKWFLSALLVDIVAAFIRGSNRKINGERQGPWKNCRRLRLQGSYLDNLGNTNTGGGSTPAFPQSYSNPTQNYDNNMSSYEPQQTSAPDPVPLYAANNDHMYDARPTYPIPGSNPNSNAASGNKNQQDFSYLKDWNNGNEINGEGNYQQQGAASFQNVPAPEPAPQYMNEAGPALPTAAQYWSTQAPAPVPQYWNPPAPPPAPAVDPSTFFLDPLPSGVGMASSSSSITTRPQFPPRRRGEPVDPFTGFPASVMMELPPSDNEVWKMEISNLKETVSSLTSQVSGYASQLSSVMSEQAARGPVPTMEEIETSIKNQFARVMEAQSGVTRQLESSIAELRTSLTQQGQSIQSMSQKDQERAQRMTNMSQTVNTVQNNVELTRANQKQLEERLMTMEKRLEEQQQRLRTASTRTDPRVIAMEAKLQEQADLLKQAISNPESRLSALEAKIGQLQRELLAVSNKPESRVAALESKMKEQQARLEAAASQPDPRIAMIEEKMRVQEEQIRVATEAISDSRITALRAKLIEQQEELEAANLARQILQPPAPFNYAPPGSPTTGPTTKNPTPALLTNPFGVPGDQNSDSKKSWLPWGNASKTPNPPPLALTPPAPPAEVGEDFGRKFLDQQGRFPSPAFGSYQNSRMRENDTLPPPLSPPYAQPFYISEPFAMDQDGEYLSPELGSYESSANGISGKLPPSLSPPRPTEPAGSFKGNAFGRGKGITIDTAQEGRTQAPPVNAANAQARFTPPLPNNEPVGSFTGNAFGRSQGITTETGSEQRAQSPYQSTISGPPYTQRGLSPPPVVPPDQDQWNKHKANPDAVNRPLIEFPKAPKRGIVPGVASDQDQWDRREANPDTVKRPIYELPKNPRGSSASSPEEKRFKISSDQDQWDPDRPNPDAVRRPLIEQKSRRPRDDGGVTSDQGRWKSDAQVKRDIDDMKAAASQPRPRATSPPSIVDDDLFRRSQILSAYLEWCKSYGSQPSENRLEQFARNYAKMEEVAQQTGQFPHFNAFADYSEEEFARLNAAGGASYGK